jgi:hypothetical protein
MLSLYPKYSLVRAYLAIIGRESVMVQDIKEMEREISAQKGTVGDFTDWKDPSIWIPERLEGVSRRIAQVLFEKSDKLLNPRYTEPIRWFIEKKDLVFVNNDGSFSLTGQGKDFATNREGMTVREIDLVEGLVKILHILAEKGGMWKKDIYPYWKSFVNRLAPEWETENSIKDLLSRRAVNLKERDYLISEKNVWGVTDAALNYLRLFNKEELGRVPRMPKIPEAEVKKPLVKSTKKEASDHDLTQLRLAELGYLMGFAVYVARSDKSKEVRGVKLAEFEIGELPAKGLSRELKDAMANIDIIWFEPEVYTPVAFIEIETTTGFVRNLQKINDLLSEMPPGYARSAGVYIVGYDKDRGEAEKIMWGDAFRRLDGRCREYKFVNVGEVATEYKNLKSRLDLQFQKIKEAEEEIEKRKKNIEKIKEGKFGLFALS